MTECTVVSIVSATKEEKNLLQTECEEKKTYYKLNVSTLSSQKVHTQNNYLRVM